MLKEALELSGDAREDALFKEFVKTKMSENYVYGLTIVDCGELELRVYEGFTDIFQRYGLTYELSTSTTLTAYWL